MALMGAVIAEDIRLEKNTNDLKILLVNFKYSPSHLENMDLKNMVQKINSIDRKIDSVQKSVWNNFDSFSTQFGLMAASTDLSDIKNDLSSIKSRLGI